MINVIVKGNKLGHLNSNLHKDGYSIWSIYGSGKIKVRPNIGFRELKKLRLTNLITESELYAIEAYKEYRELIKKAGEKCNEA